MGGVQGEETLTGWGVRESDKPTGTTTKRRSTSEGEVMDAVTAKGS